jgi:hypothetical protein
MSRLRRKTPITSITTAHSNKAFKKTEYRRERAIACTATSSGNEDVLHGRG